MQVSRAKATMQRNRLMLSVLFDRRLYCSNCLTKNKERTLCKRCVIFTTRPLSKIELLKLKAKDLIFYLQSKHISTTGCVGKANYDSVSLTLSLVRSHWTSMSEVWVRQRDIRHFFQRHDWDSFLWSIHLAMSMKLLQCPLHVSCCFPFSSRKRRTRQFSANPRGQLE